MESFDEEPEDAGPVETNQFWAAVSCLLMSFSLGGGFGATLIGTPSFGAGLYISWALGALAYILNFWGWWKYADSIIVPREDTSFRSWRVNMLAGLVIGFIAAWNFVSAFLWYSGNTAVYGTAGGGFFLALAGAWLCWVYTQNYWWNNDPSGGMLDDAEWSWFEIGRAHV